MEKEPRLSINITPGSFFKGLLIVLLFWFLFFIKDLVLVVLTAVVIASGIEPLILWFKKFRIGRLPAAIISYVVIFSVFSSLMFTFVPSILNEASSLLTNLPRYLDSAALWNPLSINSGDLTTSQKVVGGIADRINNPEQIVKDISSNAVTPDIKSTNFGLGDLIRVIQDLATNTANGFVKIVSTIFGGLLSFLLIVVLSFYLLVQENGISKFLGLITPVKHEKYVIDLWKRSQIKIGQWMQGQLLLGIIIAILVYLGLVILGVENALLLAVLTGVLELIPVFGPIIASIPAILTAFLGGGLTAAFLVIGLYIIVQQFESQLIYPLVVKKIVGVSPIIVILALIIGAKLAGFLGIVLSVPLISAFTEFVDDIEKEKILFWQKAGEIEKL